MTVLVLNVAAPILDRTLDGGLLVRCPGCEISAKFASWALPTVPVELPHVCRVDGVLVRRSGSLAIRTQ